jgi:hypothetical protein
MKKSLIFAMIVAFTLAAASAGFTAAKGRAKTASKAAANPLIGTWGIMKGNAATDVTFSADKVVFHYESEGGSTIDNTMQYKFTASPLALTFKNKEGKVLKLSMSYKINGDKLTYRFLNTKGKEIPGLPWEFSQARTADGHKDGNTIATRDRRKEEAAAREAAKVLIGRYNFDNMNTSIRIDITEDTVTFIASPAEGGKESTYVTNYKFTPSPLALVYTDEKGKTSKISMSYKIVENKLTYRFLSGGTNFNPAIYGGRAKSGKIVVDDMVAEKEPMH